MAAAGSPPFSLKIVTVLMLVVSIAIVVIVARDVKIERSGGLPVKHIAKDKYGMPYDFWVAAATGKQMRNYNADDEARGNPRAEEFEDEPLIKAKVVQKKASSTPGRRYPYCKYNGLGKNNGVMRGLCQANLNCMWLGNTLEGVCQTRVLEPPVKCDMIKKRNECYVRSDRCYFDDNLGLCKTRPL